MTIAITAASGHLGGLVVDALLARGVRPGGITAVVRDPARAAHIEARGVAIRQGNYDDFPSLQSAFVGVDKVLIISGTEVGRRVEQHANAIDAAITAGAAVVAYTSVLRARESVTNPLVAEHAATERYLEETEAPWVILRHGFYTENFVDQAQRAVRTGEIVTSAGTGRVASASRADFAEAAAAVLTTDGHLGRRYEFSGDHAWTMDEFTTALEQVSGAKIAVRHVDAAEHLEVLLGAGVKQPWAEMSVGIDHAIKAGELGAITGELSRLAGRPTTPLKEALSAVLEV